LPARPELKGREAVVGRMDPPAIPEAPRMREGLEVGVELPTLSPTVASPSEGPERGKMGVESSETGGMFNVPGFRFPYYLAIIQHKVSTNWAPPRIKPGQAEQVLVSFKILRSGQIQDLKVDVPSGNKLLDASALRAIHHASPLPPLPPLFRDESLVIQLRFTYVGDQG